MALCRQGSESLQDWNNSSGPTFRAHDHGNMRNGEFGVGANRAPSKFNRGRKFGRVAKNNQFSIGLFVLLFFCLAGLTLLANNYRSNDKGGQETSETKEFFGNQNSDGQDYTLAETDLNIRKSGSNDTLERRGRRKHGRSLVHGSGSRTSKVLGFGQGSTGSGQDSRYWDRDDRRRDEEYEEEDFQIKERNIGLGKEKKNVRGNGFNGHGEDGRTEEKLNQNSKRTGLFVDLDIHNWSTRKPSGEDLGNGGLYNERGRNELKIYEAQYEADLKEELGINGTAGGVSGDGLESDHDNGDRKTYSLIDRRNKKISQTRGHQQVNIVDNYDDGIDEDDMHREVITSVTNHQGTGDASEMQKEHAKVYGGKDLPEIQSNLPKEVLGHKEQKEGLETVIESDFDKESSFHKDRTQSYDRSNLLETQSNLPKENLAYGRQNESPQSVLDSDFDRESALFITGSYQDKTAKETHELGKASQKVDTEKRNTNSSRSKRRKHANLPCEIGFLNSTVGLVEPEENPHFAKFSLQYVESEAKPDGVAAWKPRFAGHQSVEERESSFYAQDQKLHCGFVKGPEGSLSTGFDLSKEDSKFLNTCHIAVSSCIFGNSDNIRTPTGKKVSQYSKKNVCFVMFVDEKTLGILSSEGREPDEKGYIGLWKVVVVKNLPYTDMRRTGKVAKFLTHRLFPSARYSIWLDSKMRLNSDPLLILEYFLWRGGFEYAISNHYDRHCVWEEVMQNKRLNKFNHTIIDEQFAYYQADGLTKFNASDPNKLLPSHVPEGSFIVRAHTPMSNLFSCLWFNEVDRFTPRDQLSFAYTFLKLRRMNPEKHFRLNMFKDCERRAMTKLFHHRTEETPSFTNSLSKGRRK
eukprot:Gb_16673 [translate_table: standard]